MAEGFTGGHAETYMAYLLDVNDRQDRALDLLGGKLSWNRSLNIPGSGEITFMTDDKADWTVDRVQIWYRAKLGPQTISYPMMIGVVQKPDIDALSQTTTLKFFDKVTLLAEDHIAKTVSFRAGRNVVSAVGEIIRSVGSKYNIPDDGSTLRTAMSWPVGTAKLTIVNKLLASIHYVPLLADGLGVLVSHYESSNPKIAHSFKPGPNCVAGPVTSNERDLFDIPNRIIGISTADGDKPPLTSARDNVDKDSPWSIPRRGRVLARTLDNLDMSTQKALDAYVSQQLYIHSQAAWRQTLNHFRLRLDISQAVIAPNGWSFTIEEMNQELQSGAMCETHVKRMDDFMSAKPGNF